MHVRIRLGIPLLTTHEEKGQGVKTRNFIAFKNGDEANPVLALPGQDAKAFTEAVIDNLQYGDKIEARLFNVDQAGNVSPSPLDAVFVLADTTPPDAPVGSFTLNTEEVADPGDEDATAPPVAAPPADGGGTVTTDPVLGGDGTPSGATGDSSSPPSGQQ